MYKNLLIWILAITILSVSVSAACDSNQTLYNGTCYNTSLNLLSYWAFEDNLTDFTNFNNGTPSGMSYSNDSIYGKSGDFDGSTSLVTLDDTKFAYQNFSFSFWIETDTFEQYDTPINIEHPWGASGKGWLVGSLDAANDPDIYVRDGSYDKNDLPLLSTGTWTHYVITFDSPDFNVYINANLTITNTYNDIDWTGPDTAAFGGRGNGANRFDGRLDEIGLWERELTQDEIYALYNDGNGNTLLPHCSAGNPELCTNQSECEAVGGIWNGSACSGNNLPTYDTVDPADTATGISIDTNISLTVYDADLHNMTVNITFNGSNQCNFANVTNGTNLQCDIPTMGYLTTNNWTVDINDSYGVTTTPLFTFTTEPISPIIDFYNQTPVNNSNISTNTLYFYNITQAQSTLNCTVYVNDVNRYNQTNLTVGLYNFTYNISWGDQGYNEINVTCVDYATPTSYDDDIKWVFVDSIAPSLVVHSPTNTTYTNSSVLINITATDVSLDSIWYNNGTDNITYSSEHYDVMADGSHLFTFYANDTLGHLNTTFINFTVDTLAPSLVVHSPINTTYDNSSILLNLTVSDLNLDSIWYSNGTENFSFSTYCLQETATVSTSCGGLDTGNYELTAGWGNGTNTYDGDYDTFGYGAGTILYINYTKPEESSINSLWQVANNMNSTFNITNLTIPSSCWDANPNLLSLAVQSVSAFGQTLYFCYNDTGLQQIAKLGIPGGSDYYFYEEAMWWDITLNEKYIEVPDGQHLYTFYANDTSGLMNQSSVNFTVDTLSPSLVVHSPIETVYNNNSVLINVTAADLNLDSVWYFNGTDNITYSTPNYITLSDGLYSFTFYANDTINHINQTEVNFTVGADPPVLTVHSPTNTTYTNSSVLINVTATDANLDSVWYWNGTDNVTYSSEHYDEIPDGNHLFIFYANDTFNSITSEQINFTVDTLFPELTVHSPTNTTYTNSSVLINVTATDANIDTTWYNNGTANVTYTTEHYDELPEGNHTFNFYVNDTINNINQTTVSFTIDTIAPSLVVHSPTNTTYTNSSILINVTATDTHLDTIRYWNGTDNVTYTTEHYDTLPEGNHTFTFYANDTFGNMNQTTISFTVDTLAPSLVVHSPTNTTYTSSSILINITATDTHLDTIRYWNGTDNVTYSSAHYDTLPEGNHTFTFYANDTFGNMNQTIVSFTIDSIAPSLTVHSPIATSYTNNSILINVTATDIHLDSIWYWNGSVNVTYASPNYVSVPDGPHTFIFYANDTFGNINSSSVTFSVDIATPLLTVHSPIETTYSNNSVLINVTATDTNLDSVWYYNGTDNVTYSTPNYLTLSDDNYLFTFYANDTSNNINQTSVNFTVDTTTPELIVHSPIETNYTNSSVLFNVTATDTNLDSVWYNNGTDNVTLLDYCYQETANESTLCGGLNTGSYNSTGDWQSNNNATNTYDGNYSTYGKADSTLAYLYVNYTKPFGSNNNSLWQVSSQVNGVQSTINLTILSSCWDYDTDILSLAILSQDPPNTVTFYCLDGGGFNILATRGGGDFFDERFYEEAMYWDLTYRHVTLPDDNYLFTFYANDSANNLNSTEVNFTVDSTGPVVTIHSPLNITYGTGTILLNFSSVDNLIGTDQIWYDYNGTNTTYTSEFYTAFIDGNHTIYVYSNDTLNNLGQNQISFTVDTSAPTVTITNPITTNYSTNIITINYTTLADDSCWYDNGTVNSSAVAAGTNFTNQIALEGSNTWIVYCNNTVGNIGQDSITFEVDSVYPVITVYNPTEGGRYSNSTIIINFTATDTNLDQLWYYNTTHNISYTSEQTLNLTDGNYVYIFYANDTANNINSTSINFTVDTIFPGITIYSPNDDNSTIQVNVTPIQFNMTFSDANLFGYNITCIGNNSIEYSVQAIDLNVTTIDFYDEHLFTLNGTKNCTVTVSDDHTKNKFDPKIEIKQPVLGFGNHRIDLDDGKIIFEYDDRNTNRIKTLSFEKQGDRVSPIIELKTTKESKVKAEAIPKGKVKDNVKGKQKGKFPVDDEVVEVFWTISFNGDSYIRENKTNILGHTVILPDGSMNEGYWYDAESEYNRNDVEITYEIEENKVKYRMRIKEDKIRNRKIKTRSIGGLNIINQTFNFQINNGKALNVSGYDAISTNVTPINLSINNGSHTDNYSTTSNIILNLTCGTTYTLNVTSFNYTNYHEQSFDGCDYDNITVAFWKSRLELRVRNAISLEFLTSATINITEVNGLYSTDLITNTNPTYIPFNPGNYTMNVSRTGYSDYNTTFYLNQTETESLIVGLQPVFTTYFYREQDGSLFDFVEESSPYQCENGTEIDYNYTLQYTPSSYDCSEGWDLTNDCDNTMDGLTETFGQSNSTSISEVNFTFNKPVNAINLSQLIVRKDVIQSESLRLNNTIECWDQSPLQFQAISNTSANTLQLNCYNGSEYITMQTFNNGGVLYRAYMNWVIETNNTAYSTCDNETNMYVEVEVYCPDDVLKYTVNNTQREVTGIDCQYDYWYIKAVYSVATYYRTLIPEYNATEANVYLLDLNLDEAIEIILRINDIANQYANGEVKIYKYVNGSREIVIHQLLDIEKRAVLWLDKFETYEICTIDDNGIETCHGDLIADAAGEKTITLPQLDFITPNSYAGKDIWWYYSGDKDAGTATLHYEDLTANGYNTLTWVIKDRTGTPVSKQNRTNGSNTNITVSGLYGTSDYYTFLTVDHKDVTQITEQKPLWFGSRTNFPGFTNNQGDIFKVLVAILVPILLLMIFSQASAEIGTVIMLIMMYVFNQYGWYELIQFNSKIGIPVMNIIIVLIGIFAFIGFMKKARKLE